MECATANQASQSQADSQSGHGTSGSQESPELHAEDISEEIMNFSLQEISASFSLCINCFFLSLLEKYVCLVIVFHFMPKKCFLSLSLPLISLSYSVSVHSPPATASLQWWEKSRSRNFCVCKCCLVRQSHITRRWCAHMCLSVEAATAIYIKEPRVGSAGAPSPPWLH